MKNKKIAFVGLSHLGIVYSHAAAKKNFSVTAIDSNSILIEDLKKNIYPFYEIGLKNIGKNHKINYSNNFDLIKKFDLVFISLDIKTDNKNKSNLKEFKKIYSKLQLLLKKNSTLVILSQIKPGTIANLKKRKDIKLFYQVETLIFGNAVERALYPERIIIGKNKILKISKKYHDYLLSFTKNIISTDYITAELSKLYINIFLATTISTTNILSEYTYDVGGKWTDIMRIIRSDKRLGKFAYVEPGLGISGGNIERDIENIESLVSKKINKNYFRIINDISEYHKLWPILKLKKIINSNDIIGICGISYKESTNMFKNLPIEKFIKKNFLKKTLIFDSKINIDKFNKIHKLNKTNFTYNIKDFLDKSTIIFLNSKSISLKILNLIVKSKSKKKYKYLDPNNLVKINKLNKNNVFKKFI